MIASVRIKDEVAPITEDDQPIGHSSDDTVAPYIWLDNHSDSDNSKHVDDHIDFVDIDIDSVPTLHDVYEQSFVFSRDDNDQTAESKIWKRGSDVWEAQPPFLTSATDAASEMLEKVEKSGLDHHADGSALAGHHDDSSQAPLRSMEEVFNLARREPVLLQRALVVLTCTFQIIAATALWRSIGDRVIVTELVPPLMYSSIGVVAYLLGMRYLRIHFAQVRVGDKDWLLCEQVMVAADNGVMLKARFGTAYLIWEHLLGVAQDSDYYYLIIEPSQGFKVPKQGVSDPMLQVKLDDLASLTKVKALQSA